jgi:excisionase family DNA binding protein
MTARRGVQPNGADATSPTLVPHQNGAHDVDADLKLLTIEEVADYLRVPVLTVRWLRQDGRFAPAIKVGRRLVWDVRDVVAWVESNRESGESV